MSSIILFCSNIIWTLNYSTKYNNTLNLKLSNSQLNKLTSGIKDGPEVTLKLSSNMVRDSNDENNFLHKL